MRLPFDPREQIIPAFITPIGTFEVPNAAKLNPVLENEILQREQQDLGASKSNRGGWHSQTDLLNWPLEVMPDFADSMRSAVANMVAHTLRASRFNLQVALTAWANVNRTGSWNRFHNHPECHWSGVYYVRAGDFSQEPVEGAGHIEFHDPRGAVNMVSHGEESQFGGKIRIAPQDGLMVVFPSWLYHGVNPFQSEQTRISIAFNARITKLEHLND